MTGKNIVQDLYMIEQQENEMEVKNVKITVSMSVENAGLFTSLAARFDTTRIELLEPAFEDLAREMFINLAPEDRKRVAEIADHEATELYKKQGVKIKTVGSEGSLNEVQSWRNYADMCYKVDSEEEEK